MSGLPSQQARALVAPLYRSLVPACAAVEATGALRRREPHIRTLELLLLPHLEAGTPRWGPILEAISSWAGRPVRDTPRGIVHALPGPRGIEHEILVTAHEDPSTWGLELARRTGPARFLAHLEACLRTHGYQPHLVADPPALHSPSGAVVTVPDEATLFALAGLPYVEPVLRATATTDPIASSHD